MEKSPIAPEKKEQELVTDGQAIEAMKAENFELVRTWYAEQETQAEAGPSIGGHMNLTLRMAELQMKAGLTDDARETFDAAYEDAYQQGDDMTAGEILKRIAAL